MTETFTPMLSAEEAAESLREALPADSTVYSVLRRVNRKGTCRHISFLAFVNGRPINITAWIAALFSDKIHRVNGHNTLRVSGGGMDMGYHVFDNMRDRAKLPELLHEWL